MLNFDNLRCVQEMEVEEVEEVVGVKKKKKAAIRFERLKKKMIELIGFLVESFFPLLFIFWDVMPIFPFIHVSSRQT